VHADRVSRSASAGRDARPHPDLRAPGVGAAAIHTSTSSCTTRTRPSPSTQGLRGAEEPRRRVLTGADATAVRDRRRVP
jgi:hypothetical protein